MFWANARIYAQISSKTLYLHVRHCIQETFCMQITHTIVT